MRRGNSAMTAGPGEKRAVVVCQHGRNGVPKDVIEGDQKAYHDFAARLADEVGLPVWRSIVVRGANSAQPLRTS